jgi:hypothetical protein
MALTLRHRAAIQRARAAGGQQHLRLVKPRTPSTWDRLVEAAWRLHDDSFLIWALIFVIVMLASCAATVALIAMALGWRP